MSPSPWKHRHQILIRLRSFGSTVGAPILFFVGGFIFTVIDIQNSLGDNDSAHALAFGMCNVAFRPLLLPFSRPFPLTKRGLYI